MAVAVIVGIMFATVLTLILVPVMYSLVDDLSAFFRRHYVSAEVGSEGSEGSGSGPEGSEADDPAGLPEAEPAGVFRKRSPAQGTPDLTPQTEQG
jgi:hypothetical protein